MFRTLFAAAAVATAAALRQYNDAPEYDMIDGINGHSPKNVLAAGIDPFNQVVSLGYDGYLKLWRGGQVVKSTSAYQMGLSPSEQFMSACVFRHPWVNNAMNQLTALGTRTGNVVLVNPYSGTVVHKGAMGGQFVLAAASSPGGLLVTANNDGVAVWRPTLDGNVEMTPLESHPAPGAARGASPVGVAVDDAEARIACVYDDGSIFVFDVLSGQGGADVSLKASGKAASMAMDAAGGKLIVGLVSGAVEVYNLSAQPRRRTATFLQGASHPAWSVAVAPGAGPATSGTFVRGGQDGVLNLIEFDGGAEVNAQTLTDVAPGVSMVVSMAFSSAGDKLVVAGQNVLRVYAAVPGTTPAPAHPSMTSSRGVASSTTTNGGASSTSQAVASSASNGASMSQAFASSTSKSRASSTSNGGVSSTSLGVASSTLNGRASSTSQAFASSASNSRASSTSNGGASSTTGLTPSTSEGVAVTTSLGVASNASEGVAVTTSLGVASNASEGVAVTTSLGVASNASEGVAVTTSLGGSLTGATASDTNATGSQTTHAAPLDGAEFPWWVMVITLACVGTAVFVLMRKRAEPKKCEAALFDPEVGGAYVEEDAYTPMTDTPGNKETLH
eukprot:TRINITY_DN3968_c1_g3_i2.p1 TRINITY_DN3968_c1_g3~~TRINITY_DN3968_c1_g3_i2.p1  ORF type:complete len:616 (+),score=165.73 TRINITY_DN3968_c1_g3_i2:82-1929(+)